MNKIFSKLDKQAIGCALLFLLSAATIFCFLVGAEGGFSRLLAEWRKPQAFAQGNLSFEFAVLRFFIMPVVFCILSGAVPFFYWGKGKFWRAFICAILFFFFYVLWQVTFGLELIVNVT